MRFHVLTLFPDMIENACSESILGRAAKNGIVEVNAVNIRDFTDDPHGKVDDYPYGGGPGMVMRAQPVYSAYEHVMEAVSENGGRTAVIYLTARGRTLSQQIAKEYSAYDDIILLCGHYEGIDERVIEEISPDEISVGDYILTGGELPALTLIDCVSRLLPGVLHNDMSASEESFENGLLEYPQYTRPECWHEKNVPGIILSGDHAAVDRYRKSEAERVTAERRPDLFGNYSESAK